MECFACTVNGLKSLTDYAKALYLRCFIKRFLNTPLLKNKAGVRCAKKTPRRLYVKCNIFILYDYIIYFVLHVLKYFNDISGRFTVQSKVRKFMNWFYLTTFSFNCLSLFGSFCLVFPSRLSVTFNIQIDLKVQSCKLYNNK